MKKTWIVAAACASALLASTAMAAGSNVAYVDVKVAVENTASFQVGIKKLEALKTQKEKELQALADKITQLNNDLQGQAMVMAPDRLAGKQQEVNELRKSLARMQQDAQEVLVTERDRLYQSNFKRFYDVVNSFSKSKGLDMVVSKSALVYGNPSLDVTSEITKLLDAQGSDSAPKK